MNVHDFSGGDPLEVEGAQIARRRQLAELLAQQSMAPTPVYSNKAGIARLLGGVLSGIDRQKAEGQEMDLAKRREEMDKAETARIFEGAKTGDRAALAKLLAESQNPAMRKAGLAMVLQQEKPQGYTLKEGETRYGADGRILNSNLKPEKPEKPPEGVRTLEEMMKHAGIDPASDIGKAIFKKALEKSTTHQPATSVTVDNKAPSAFWKEFGEGEAKGFKAEQDQAKGAAQMLQSIGTARDLLSKGIYTGAGADWRLSAGKLLRQAGFNLNQDDIANTEAFKSTMGQQVLAGIKQLGAGSAISNADRDFMEKVVGGQISLDPKGIERILAISEQVSRARISSFNKKAAAIQKQAPAGFLPYGLEVQEPAQITVDDALKLYGSKP